MNTEKITLRIVDGPNRDYLFDAFKYAYGQEQMELTITFKVLVDHTDNPQVYSDVKDVAITAIQYEDGSGESFNLEGWGSPPESARRAYGGIRPDSKLRFKAYYNAGNRTGWLNFIK